MRVRSGMVAGALALSACAASATPQPVPATAPPSATPRTSPAPPPSPRVPSTAWELRERAWDPRWSPMELRAAATDGDHLVVVGGEICDTPEFSYEMPCDAGIWSAPVDDPSALEPVPSHDDLFVGTAHPVTGPLPGTIDVASGANGFVAIGYRGMATTPVEPAIWFSVDGLSWQLAEMDGLFNGATLDAITTGGPGFVVVGKVASPAAPRAAVWVSDNGLSWERVPDAEAFEVGGYINTGEIPTSGGMRRVVLFPGGPGLVAIGVRCERGGTLADPGPMGSIDSCRWTTWSSPDGIGWSQSPRGLEPRWSLMSAAAMDDQLVAVGGTFLEATAQPSIGLSLVSGDGVTWEPYPLEGVPRLDLVVGVPDGVMAFSTDDRALRVWGSSDGQAWTEIAGIPQVEGLAVVRGIGATVVGDRVVVVGSAETSTAENLVGFTLVGPASATAP